MHWTQRPRRIRGWGTAAISATTLGLSMLLPLADDAAAATVSTNQLHRGDTRGQRLELTMSAPVVNDTAQFERTSYFHGRIGFVAE